MHPGSNPPDAEIVSEPRPDRRPGTALDALQFLDGGGELGATMRHKDWSHTPLGPLHGWPQSLLTAVSVMLTAPQPAYVFWGPDLAILYNDRGLPFVGLKHPACLGLSIRTVLKEAWPVLGPLVEGVMSTGTAVYLENLLIPLERIGFLQDGYFTFSYIPIRNEAAAIGGILVIVNETTSQVLGERRLAIIRELSLRAALCQKVADVLVAARTVLADSASDVPFALLYELRGRRGELVVSAGIERGLLASPLAVDLDAEGGWPLAEVCDDGGLLVDDLTRFGSLPGGPSGERATRAVLLPLAAAREGEPSHVLVAGLNPRYVFDDDAKSFLQLVARQIATSITSTRALEEKTLRAAQLAELDRQKTEFFSNVSHEFRTPLTLMLGPVEDALEQQAVLGGEALASVHRNALRLLKLVNNLLDFSRVEAGRARASFRPVDLAQLTTDLASGFRSVVESAGMVLEISCIAGEDPVYVDVDMWEKIVLNLLSNAFKFTFEGKIVVELRRESEDVVLSVTDTGVGIPDEHLPRLFDRFHRVEGTKSRTHEGSGIGLALVSELVRLHHGAVDVRSRVGVGSTFSVTVPRGSAQSVAAPTDDPLLSTATKRSAYVEEAQRWTPVVPSASPRDAAAMESEPSTRARRILVAEDNADMRDYLTRLLSERWTVETAVDGARALEMAVARPPDVIVSDVMMPGLDGLALVTALRTDERTCEVPFILLSARADEQSTTAALDAGASDYMIKPFSARELMARVGAQLEIAAVQRRARQRLELAHAREQSLRSEAETASRVAQAANRAKDEFLAMLGHELRNPLAPIGTALQLMRLRGDESSAKEREVIERQVRHLETLVSDLLDVSRITQGKIALKRRRVEVSELLSAAIEMASPLLEQRHHHLDVQVVRSGLVVDGDVLRLEQVLANLITNAAKYTEPDGHITIRARRDEGMVVVEVQDDGIGIAPDMLSRVFDLFSQVPQSLARSQGGLGLGLSLVRGITELHGGRVRAESPGDGHGSTFTIELPAADGSAVAIVSEGRPSARPDAHVRAPDAERVLVIDDNEDAAESLADLLRALGHEAEVAYDGPRALLVAREFRPTIALLDIGLPVMDGYELARRLRSERAVGIRLVAVTGYGQLDDRRRSEAAGFDAHLVKPVQLDELTHVLRARERD